MTELTQTGHPILAILATLLAFIMGFTIRRGSVCAVIASKHLVVYGKQQRFLAMLVAGAVAGAVILPLAWLLPSETGLAYAYPITATMIGAAALYALGARLNDGCAFGTLSRLSGGELSYLGTVAGMVAGAIATQHYRGDPIAGTLSSMSEPTAFTLSLWLVMVIVAISVMRQRHFRNIAQALAPGGGILRPFTAMIVIGIVGGLLYSLAGSWTYLALLEKQALVLSGDTVATSAPKATAGALALLTGAVAAAWRSGRFHIRMDSAAAWVTRFIGGIMIGSAAALIPGGNGALVVYGIPSGAPNAVVSLVIIMALLLLSFIPRRKAKRAASRQASLA